MREAQGASLLGVLRLDRDPLGTEGLQNWVLSRTENTENARSHSTLKISPQGRPQCCASHRKAQMRAENLKEPGLEPWGGEGAVLPLQ